MRMRDMGCTISSRNEETRKYSDSRQTSSGPEQTEAWILGTGTASLASAFYLIKHAKIPPQKVHILESRDSVQEVFHQIGDSSSGYDQFAGCLPAPIGGSLKEILACIPSSMPSIPGQVHSFLRDIQSAEVNRHFAKESSGTEFLIQKHRMLRTIATGSLNLNFKHRLSLIWLILKREKRLGRNQIKDFFPEHFFLTPFWAIWSAQFGLQPWHSAVEFRRALLQYLDEFHSLSILNCLDITGHYQYESIFLPIYLFLRALNVDFQFDTKITGMVTTSHNDVQTISRLEVIQNGFQSRKELGPYDIVIATLGSTESGTAKGSNDDQPVTSSFDAYEDLNENWSLWFALASQDKKFGNPYNFCTRRSESMLESFTITTEDLPFFNHLTSLSQTTLTTGAFIVLRESQWKLNLCIPAQPVFRHQPEFVRVPWGVRTLPRG
ncbi:hypothetical protein N7475_009231 [Penicillium sp. IBT 31633x]|nr:hypothetical protein N7475_009231 [Penicillium sp. IBT 31633x]